jgi:hypothetical protein
LFRLAKSAEYDDAMIDVAGLQPNRNAGNRREINSDLPCLGGNEMINRFKSPVIISPTQSEIIL